MTLDFSIPQRWYAYSGMLLYPGIETYSGMTTTVPLLWERKG